jgi:hypothetical protein
VEKFGRRGKVEGSPKGEAIGLGHPASDEQKEGCPDGASNQKWQPGAE